MKMSASFICFPMCVVAIFLAFAMPAGAASQDADGVASDIRATYAPLLAEYSRIFMGNGKMDCIEFALTKDIASPSLKAMLIKEENYRKKSQSVGHLDFDFLYNAQDDSGKPLSIVSIDRLGDTYVMKVSNGFQGVAPHEVVLVNNSGRWMIEDVRYYEGKTVTTLRKILKP